MLAEHWAGLPAERHLTLSAVTDTKKYQIAALECNQPDDTRTNVMIVSFHDYRSVL